MTTHIEIYFNSLPNDILTLDIRGEGITSLPDLTRFKNLKTLYCSKNKLTVLPTLPQNLQKLSCSNNPIYEIVNNYSLIKIEQNIQTLNDFRHLYYCLKFKKQLRKWLWEKVREHNAKKRYSPMYLIENLGEDDDLDTVLDNWQ